MSPKLFVSIIFSFLLSISADAKAKDTLYTNPNYPPLVYSAADYDFFKYTAKYIPSSLFEAFRILGTNDIAVIERFKERTVSEVVLRGLFYKQARLRKEFGLTGYSSFTKYFHDRGIYYPKAMETFILLSFHQYLNQEKILWSKNKKMALERFKKANRYWKKRKRKLFKNGKVKVKESKRKRKSKKITKEELEYRKMLFPEGMMEEND